MLVNTKAIVISAIKYSEADLIVKCFTQISGIKTYLLRGILKSKKTGLKASQFQLLTQLEIVAKHKDKGSLEGIREAKVQEAYQTLHSNFYKTSMVLFIAEMLKNTIKEEETNLPLFDFLENSFNWLDRNEEIANFHLLFLLNLTKYLGFHPENPKQGFTYFNMLDGTFQNMETNNYCISGENLNILTRLLGTNFEDLKNLKLSKAHRNDFLNMMLIYYNLHLHHFVKPKSLAVLNEIYS